MSGSRRKEHKSSKAIGILVSYVGGYMYGVVEGVRQVATEYGVDVIVYSMMSSYRETNNRLGDKDAESLQETLSLVKNSNLMGLVINTDVADYVNKSLLIDFMDQNPQMSYVCISADVGDASLIVTDNYGGMRSAVEHVIEHHRKKRIAFIGGPSENNEAQDRFRAYQDTLEDHGIPFDPELYIPATWFVEDGEKSVYELLDNRKVVFDALIGANDNLAMGAMTALKQRGFIVPEDVIVVGFDNSIFAINYSITSVKQSVMDFGRSAGREIIENFFEGKELPKVLLAETELIRRLSCGCQNRVERRGNTRLGVAAGADSFTNILTNSTEDLLKSLLQFKDERRNILKVIEGIRRYLEADEQRRDGFRSDFFGILNDIVLEQEGLHESLYQWQRLFLNLHHEVIALGPSQFEAELLNHLFFESNLLFAEELARVDGSKGIEFDTLFYDTIILGQRIMASTEIEEVGKIFIQAIKILKVNNGYFATYQEPVPDSSGVDLVNLVCTLREGESQFYSPEKSLVPFIEVDPRIRLNVQDHMSWLVLPLGIGGLYYGHIVFQMLFDPTQWTQYRALQINMAQALRNIHSIKLMRDSRLAADLANTAKGDFLSRMTHELRTPMNGVIGMTSLLLESDLSSEQQELVNTIKSSGNSLLDIIGDLLDFSKIEAGKVEIENVDFDLRSVVEECIGAVSAQASEKDVNLLYQLNCDHSSWVNLDQTHYRQVLANLLSNAIKFTSSGEVKVRIDVIEHDSELLRITTRVTDSGIGIPEEKQKALFQPFSQADVNIHRKFGGTGLGLAISKNLAELMGGQMMLESSGSQGSCFKFAVLARKPNLHGNTEIKLSNDVLQKFPRVIVCSSLPSNRQLIYEQLQALGLQTEQVTEFDDLIHHIERESVDLAVIEKPQKGSDWLDKIKRIKDLNSKLHIVLYLSLSEKVDTFSNISNVSLVYKPVRPQLLINAIEQLLSPAHKAAPKKTKSEFVNLGKDHPLRILLAEDNLVNQKVAQGMLSKCGYQVEIANHGLQALEMAKKSEYDVIFMDIFMPEMDGLTASKAIRKEIDYRQPTIVALTANTNRGDKENLLREGMDSYLSKPLQVSSLVSELKKIISDRN